MKPISNKRRVELAEYNKLIWKLRELCGNSSELDGAGGFTECHHVNGRVGKNYLDVFNLIIVSPEQHREIHAHNTWEQKQKLLAIVKKIREAQGFQSKGYE